MIDGFESNGRTFINAVSRYDCFITSRVVGEVDAVASSVVVCTAIASRKHNIAASRQAPTISAPVILPETVSDAKRSISIIVPSAICFDQWWQCIDIISRRPSKSGGGTYITLSNRPGRNNAVSSVQGRLVAPRTSTPSFHDPSTPSISFKNVDKTRASTADPRPIPL